MARIHRPTSPSRPTQFTPEPQFLDLPVGTEVVRLFDPTEFHTQPLTMRPYGPLRRWDHHAGHGKGRQRRPADSSDRGLFYAAETLGTCLAEIFGSTCLVIPDHWHVALISLKAPVRLLDVRGENARLVGANPATFHTEKHMVCQEWSRFFYEDAVFQQPMGLCYSSVETGGTAYAFYERASLALECSPSQVIRLDDPALRAVVAKWCQKYHLKMDTGFFLPDP